MKLHRSLMITILMVVLPIVAAILLSGCASTGNKKDNEPETESTQADDKQSTALKETGESSPETGKEPVVKPGGSGEKPYAQEVSFKGGENRLEQFATGLKQRPDRTRPKILPDTEWNPEVTAVAGIVAMSVLSGVAFRLARRPRRGRSTGRRRGSAQVGEHVRGSVPQRT